MGTSSVEVVLGGMNMRVEAPPNGVEYRLVDKWPEDTEIEWWNSGRRCLNNIIKVYNTWQVRGFPANGAPSLRAIIIQGIESNSLGSQDGGGDWREELEGMLEHVDQCIEALND